MVCMVQDFVEPGIKLEKKANTLSPVHNNDDGSANVMSRTSQEKVVFSLVIQLLVSNFWTVWLIKTLLMLVR